MWVSENVEYSTFSGPGLAGVFAANVFPRGNGVVHKFKCNVPPEGKISQYAYPRKYRGANSTNSELRGRLGQLWRLSPTSIQFGRPVGLRVDGGDVWR